MAVNVQMVLEVVGKLSLPFGEGVQCVGTVKRKQGLELQEML